MVKLTRAPDWQRLARLGKEALDLAANSLKPATRKAYQADWDQFALWCESNGIDSLPAEPAAICLYIAEIQHKLKVSSITRALTSIGVIHALKGLENPVKTPQVKTVLTGLKKKKGMRPDKATPIGFADLQKMISLCPPSMVGLRDAAILAIGWGGALRRAEICALNFRDLALSSEGIAVTIRQSKNDPQGRGRVVAIPRAPKGRFCLVSKIENWIDRLEKSRSKGDKTQAIFRRLGSQGRQFFSAVGPRLSPRSVALIVSKYAALVGLHGDFSGHSLRRGLATEAARAGAPQWAIKQHTGHASSDQLNEYIEAGRLFIDSPLLPILQSPGKRS